MSDVKVFDFSAFPTLETERLVLREPVSSDAPDVFVFRSDAEVQKYNDDPMVDVSQAITFIQEHRDEYAAQQRILWAITFRDENRVLGLCGFNFWNRRHNRASIGYDLARAYWGQGIATEAVGAMLRFGFKHMRLHRIEATTIVDNVESVRLLRRLGFQLEGVRREYSLEDDGAYHGSAVYGLLRREYYQQMPGVS
jgi:ribosomal-protein-alanine N-acetyltransferase